MFILAVQPNYDYYFFPFIHTVQYGEQTGREVGPEWNRNLDSNSGQSTTVPTRLSSPNKF